MPLTDDLPLISARPRLSIDGQACPNLDEALLAMQVHLPRDGMANAELRMLNWGTTGEGPDFLFSDLRLGSRLELCLGGTAATTVFRGEITAIEESYGDGAPQIVILAEDALHRLARQRHSRSFEDMSLDAVVRQIAAEGGLTADVQVSAVSNTWLQVNESNLAFLLRQLAPYAVGLRLDNGQLRARDDEPDPQPLALTQGGNALNIRLIADLNHLPRQVGVKGYNLQNDGAADGSSSSLNPQAASGQSGTALLADLGWEGDSILPHPFARSQQEAEALASRQFRQRACGFLHGEILCQGASNLQSGREVVLSGVSPRLQGRYRVMECWHQFDLTHGLSTRIRVQRPDWNR